MRKIATFAVSALCGAAYAAVPTPSGVDLNLQPRANTIGAFEPVSIDEPDPGVTLPMTDSNGNRSEKIRVVARAADTVLANYAPYAVTLPAACDATLSSGATMADLETAMNNALNNLVCVNPGVNLGTAIATFERNSCTQPVIVAPSNYAEFAPSDRLAHPLNLSESARAIIGRIDNSGDTTCNLVLYNVEMRPADWPAMSCALLAQNGINLTNVYTDYGIGLQNCVNTEISIHNSHLSTFEAQNDTDLPCVALGAGQGGNGASQGAWITHNEIDDCHGTGVHLGPAGSVQDGGTHVEFNDFESSPAHRTDCAGQATSNDADACQPGGSAIVVVIGNSDGTADAPTIRGNRIRGWRETDPERGGTATGPNAAIRIEGDASQVIVADNIIWRSHSAISSNVTGTLVAGSNQRHSIVGNMFQLQPFTVQGDEAYCVGNGGAVQCQGFNRGIGLLFGSNSRVAFNTMRFDVLAGVTPRYVEFGVLPQQFIGGAWVDSGTAPSAAPAGSEVDCNAYQNTGTLADATEQYVGDLGLVFMSTFIDPISNPREAAIAEIRKPAGYVAATLCSGISIDLQNFGNPNDGVRN